MKICGVITEYNPFHLGHQFQIDEIKKRFEVDYIIVVMSGNFVQRGEPAIFDQFTRTKLALIGGADVVIQLPTFYSTASAENFAYGAVSLLNQLGIIDILCFGSESGEINQIKDIAKFLSNEPANFKNALKSELKKGFSYPKARSLALNATYHHNPLDDLLKGSNNILGIEYLKALYTLKSHITPTTIQRVGASYLSESFNEVLPSASAIRKHFYEKSSAPPPISELTSAMPIEVVEALISHDYSPIYMDDIFQIIKYQLEIKCEYEINDIYDFNIQLFKRLKNSLDKASNYKDFLNIVTTKNYTKTTIQRSIMHMFLNIKTSDLNYLNSHGHQYVRILGFKKSSKEVLHKLKNTCELPLVTNVKDHYKLLTPYGKYLLETEIKYTNIYNQLVVYKYHINKNNDYRQAIIVV